MNRVLISLILLCACARAVSAQELTFRTSLSCLTDLTEIRKMSSSVSYPAFDLKLGWQLPRDASYYGAFVGFSVRLNRFVQSDYMEFTVGKHF
ncbi:MAG: hypothetical protein GXY24_06275 [Bacteroidales bacterium]|jgi:hypothetical protein|nr:hypothetical protein [Bacteroidales bacterium]